MYQKKQIDIEKEEKIAREKELKIYEDKIHQLNIQMKRLEVRDSTLTNGCSTFLP